ncbi:NADP-dependent malic enzyme [Solitalea lacus]|uniref:NADP-dependent malic enzyme n=1 Tax=Solitalea lacus TaxID=2911172 RepID=UPI001EDC2611|nr:NADP-dependent malic enzyme [Solitalea lacus]UKJ08288.1 NADP-dependent malic enzyme [Solitalea lacus]
MSKTTRKQDALDYHALGRPGKVEVVPTKATNSQRDLSLAYSPGVAEPCLRIAENKDDVYKYTAKGNLVAVISNGTAVLGLGNIGPEAGKPVMEGKGVLFKIFADIDVFDIELNVTDVDEFVRTVKALEPTFGGVNLEDIKAPECFEIERRLKEEMNIPVMHDDQHGTAIISAAALLNALELQNKKIENVKIVVGGAGAAAMSCTRLYVSLGARKENIVMLDSKGVIRSDRDGLDASKKEFATERRDVKDLAEAMVNADVFIGLSAADTVSADMLKTMAANAIVFAMANPDPEIGYELATATRNDIIMATGRSDYPNQVNNVLGFPYIFRGALDVQSTQINEEMKLAAVKAIAELAKKPVPEAVNLAYNQSNIVFGKDYIIPKPLDMRLITHVAPAVAKAAMESGVARKPITDWDAYIEGLKKRLGLDDKLMRSISQRAKTTPKRVVFAEADNYKMLKAAQIVKDDNIAIPILLGDIEKINALIEQHNLDLAGTTIIDPFKEPKTLQKYAAILYKKRQRRGVSMSDALKLVRDRNYFGSIMVELGEADAMISGLTKSYKNVVKPALEVIGTRPGVKKVAGMYMMLSKRGPIFFADTTVNLDPTPSEIVDITLLVSEAVETFNIKPRVALLSYSNFGSSAGASAVKMREAVSILHKEHPSVLVDGEVQANFAINTEMMQANYPFSCLADGPANTLIFPNLESGNIAYKLLQEVGGAEAVGPILLGLNKPVHVLQMDSSVREIVNMVTVAVVDAQQREKLAQ